MNTEGLHRRPGLEEERRQRVRYDFLERIYLLAGADGGRAVLLQEVEAQFGPTGGDPHGLAAELAALGYLCMAEDSLRVRLTFQAIDYLQRGAWRRRTIRCQAARGGRRTASVPARCGGCEV